MNTQKASTKEQYRALVIKCQQYLANMKNRDDAAEYQKLVDTAQYYLAEATEPRFWEGVKYPNLLR